MSTYEVIDATPAHVMALRERLREADKAELFCFGIGVNKALWRSYRRSLLCRTLLIDGKVSAVGGCSASPLGAYGEPWLLTAPDVEKIPVSFVKEGRRQIRQMLEIYPLLQNYVLASYGKACGFLELLGFTLDEPFVAPNGHGFCRFWMER